MMENTDLPALDREVFSAVWSRVVQERDTPVELTAPLAAVPAPHREGEAIQHLAAALMEDAERWEALAALSPRGGTLRDMAARRRQGGRALWAVYFLRSGVDCSPLSPRREGGEGFRPLVRRQFWLEKDRRGQLLALAGAVSDPDLRALCLDLARQTEEGCRLLREAVT